MRIGVDAYSLSKQITGIGRYTLELCRVLSANPSISLYLYSPSPITDEAFNLNNVIYKTGKSHSRIYKQFWAEMILPHLLKQDRLDVFWGAAHFLPRHMCPKIAYVVTIHDLVWKFAKETMHPITYWLEKFHMPFSVQNAHQIVAVSMATAKDLQKEFNLDQDKIKIIPLGVPEIKYESSQDDLKKIGIEHNYFLFVGTLEPRKNLIRLLHAYANLPEALKQSTMLVIVGGKGWGNLQVEQIIEQLSLQNHIKLIGYVTDAILSVLYANAMFLAMPSLYEGFGLPIIEAMNYGIPALSSNISSMPEVVGDAGILVDPFDIQAIQAGLLKLLGDKNFLAELALRAKKNVERFNWKISGEKLIQTFHEAILLSKHNYENSTFL